MLVAAVAAVAAVVAVVAAVVAAVAAPHIPPTSSTSAFACSVGSAGSVRLRLCPPLPATSVTTVTARHGPPSPFPPPFPSPSLHLVHLHFAVMASVPRGPHAQLGPLSSVPRHRCLLSDLNLSDLNLRSRLRSPATFLSPRAVAGTQPLPLPPPPAHCWYGYGGGAPPYWP
jgi:hypothetical protein